MTMAEARKKAKKQAWRNTAVLAALAAGQYGAHVVKRKLGK